MHTMRNRPVPQLVCAVLSSVNANPTCCVLAVPCECVVVSSVVVLGSNRKIGYCRWVNGRVHGRGNGCAVVTFGVYTYEPISYIIDWYKYGKWRARIRSSITLP